MRTAASASTAPTAVVPWVAMPPRFPTRAAPSKSPSRAFPVSVAVACPPASTPVPTPSRLTWVTVLVGDGLGSLTTVSIGYASLILGFSLKGSELAAMDRASARWALKPLTPWSPPRSPRDRQAQPRTGDSISIPVSRCSEDRGWDAFRSEVRLFEIDLVEGDALGTATGSLGSLAGTSAERPYRRMLCSRRFRRLVAGRGSVVAPLDPGEDRRFVARERHPPEDTVPGPRSPWNPP